ncbi:MAG: ABC transporter permease [Spirillospora sp.]
MRGYLLRRVLQAVPALLGVTLVAFVLVRFTGDPAQVMLPPEAPPEEVARFRADAGLDKPLPLQFLYYVGNAVTGDFGDSIRYKEPVSSLIGQRLPATLQLALYGILLATLIGVPLGMLAALRRGSWIDSAIRVVTLFSQAVPSFYFGLLLILVFGVSLEVLPTGGASTSAHYVLPAVTLAVYLIPLVLRISRGATLDVARQDYVRTARAKGTPERRVVGVHILKNALIPVVTVIGLQLGYALSGAIVIETVFAWPGVGQLMINAVFSRDFPVVQGAVVFAAVVFILVNLVVDVLYAVLDPRIRLS